MPAKPSWFLKVPAILGELRALEIPLLDRSAIERLFGIRRRRAHHLMARFGGVQAGRTFLVNRLEVIQALDRILQGEDFQQETRRKARIGDFLEEARRQLRAREVRIAPVAARPSRQIDHLPPGIALFPGHLHIQFDSAQQLLEHLFELAQTISDDYERFERLLEQPRNSAALVNASTILS